MEQDVIVVGGSFAGLSAATQLARARRRVLVIDAGKPRNRFAHASYGFLGQDGESPADILATGRSQLLAYPTASVLDASVTSARQVDGGFVVALDDGTEHVGKRMILAHGVSDRLPDVPGLAERWGRSVFHCPYCHGYELAQGHTAVLAVGPLSMHHAMMLPDWGPTTFLLNGAFSPDAEERAALAARGCALLDLPVEAVADGADGGIAVRFVDGTSRDYAGLFVASQIAPASPLAEALGCALAEGPLGHYVRTDDMKATSVPGVFACGDAARMAGNVPFAVADGAFAGVAAHRSLIFAPTH